MDHALHRRGRKLLIATLLLAHGAMLAWIGLAYAPVFDEVAHLTSGLSHWSLGTFGSYRVNPPLPRMTAALGVLAASPKLDWSEGPSGPYARPEFAEGRRFVELNGSRTTWLFTLGRWSCLVYSLMGGWICYRWARRLFGFDSGAIALTLWCWCPNVLAWGGLIMPDVPGASFGVAAGYYFWRWLRAPSWLGCSIAGVALGLAQLSKTTWIILFVLWPFLWLLDRAPGTAPRLRSPRGRATQLAAILGVAVYIVNLGYGFEGTLRPLRDFEFTSSAMGGRLSPPMSGNRFRDSWLGSVRVPLPSNYVQGLDVQRREFEHGKWSYLNGRHKFGGWYHYYLYALSIKTPLGTLALALMAVGLYASSRRYRLPQLDESSLMVPPLAVLLLVSSQTGFNRYLRYALPALPFLFISIARVGKATRRGPRTAKVLVLGSLAFVVIDSMSVFPHSMSYFNAIVGGPMGGPAHLLDANVDWGQDLLYVKRWMHEHPSARPFHLQYFGVLDPELVGVRAAAVPKGPTAYGSSSDPRLAGPRPGWYAVSVNSVFGYGNYGGPQADYTYFQRFRPVDSIGYSIYVYHLTTNDVDQVRRELGSGPLRSGEAGL